MRRPPRVVLPELLDELDPEDPRARRSREDLRRVHRLMGSVSVLEAAVRRLQLAAQPRRILELGAGDGSLLLRLGRALPHWREIDLTLLDRHDLLSQETREAYGKLGWTVTMLRADALFWALEEHSMHFDLCIANLFLHHFASEPLVTLMAAIQRTSHAFIACEPRRNTFAQLGSRLVGLLGANSVTREDAVKSVTAGFSHEELTSLWSGPEGDWLCDEYSAPPFTHCFTAVRASARQGESRDG